MRSERKGSEENGNGKGWTEWEWEWEKKRWKNRAGHVEGVSSWEDVELVEEDDGEEVEETDLF